MRRSTISNTQPVVKQINLPPSAQPKSDPVPKSDVQPVNRSPNAAGSGGLDDLFGFGNQEGRMKIPRAIKTNQAPAVQPVPQAKSAESPASEPESKPKAAKIQSPPVKPLNRSPNAAGSGGLDDLFGFGNQEGRMKIPRSTPEGAGTKKNKPIFDKNPVQKPIEGNPPSKK